MPSAEKDAGRQYAELVASGAIIRCRRIRPFGAETPCACADECSMDKPISLPVAEKDAGLHATASGATTWNGGICGMCAARYLGSHTCSVVDLLERSDELRRLAMEAFERLNPQPTTGPPTGGSDA